MTFQLTTAVILTGELFHFGTHWEKNRDVYEFREKSMVQIQQPIYCIYNIFLLMVKNVVSHNKYSNLYNPYVNTLLVFFFTWTVFTSDNRGGRTAA